MPRSRSASATNRTSDLEIRLDTSAHAGPLQTYAIAGRTHVADAPLAPLAPFAVAMPADALFAWPAAPVALGGESPVYRGPAWVGGRFADVACARAGDGYVVRIAGLPALLVDRRGCRVMVEGGAATAPSDALVEALLGPGLIVPLALAGAFTLHASAVARDSRAALLLGESGAGKSTVARAAASAPPFAPLADDVLPCEASAAGLTALPHYPQLKLAGALQYAASRPARVPVRAILVLAPDAVGGAVAIERLGRREAFLALAAHTVAARLFDAALLERHAAFCAAATEAVAVHRLAFPRRPDALPAMVAAIAAHLALSS